MTNTTFTRRCTALLAGPALVLLAAPVWAVDADAAERLAKDNKCVKCHAIDRKKDAPAYRDIAAKYRGEADAEAKLMHHVTAGEPVKFADGHQEKHKKVKADDPAEVKNLVGWIMSLPGGTKY
jgi:cytochrome c